MHTTYGHVKIGYGGDDYILSPSLKNIASLGTPIEIIETFKDFVNPSTPTFYKLIIAFKVLDCCSDRPIPDEILGVLKFNEDKNQFEYISPAHSSDMSNDALVLAEHCLIHGICGKVDNKEKESGEPLDSFDPYEYIETARVCLDIPLSEASDMTMTEFVRMMKMKIKISGYKSSSNASNASKEPELTPGEELAMIEAFNKGNGVH